MPHQNIIQLQIISKNSDYKIYKFKDILVDETRKVKKIKKADYLSKGKNPIVDQSKDFISGYTDCNDKIYKQYPYILFGDHTRVFKYINFESYLGADGAKIINVHEKYSEKIDIKYIYYFLKSVGIPDTGYNRHFKYVKSLLFPVPPMEIQEKIVKVLDQAQALIDKRREQIEALDQLIESIFYTMFGDPVSNEKGWEVKELGELSSLVTKGSSPNWQGIEYVTDDSQVLFVTSENVREGYLDLSKRKYLQNEFNEKQKRSILKKGDFLINIVGASIGRACMFDIETKANINQAVSLVRLKNECINEKYLLFFLNSKSALLQYDNMKVSVARANLSLQNIKDLEILNPPIQFQNQFAEKVQVIEKQKEVLEESLKLLEENYKSIMEKAFKGQLFN